ncbi:P-loop containing nucleoside triphosphate hydrolase protein [Mycena vitilis]|nr:P-loop containing nucleoside triphosphate hydrolase protein [Mycena vitilis]
MPVPPERHYVSDFFDSASLTSVEDVERIAEKFETLLYDKKDDAELILDELVSHEQPAIVRVVLSWINERWILKEFPLRTAEEFNRSRARQILSQLSVYFQYTPTSIIDRKDEERPVDERVDKRRMYFRQLVKDAPDVLAALATKLTQADAVPSNTKLSQKQMKQARRAAAKASAPLDPGPFERLDIAVPETREEVEESIQTILANQESILEAYLTALHSPELEASIWADCLPNEPILPPQLETEVVDEEETTAILQTVTPSDPEALYPTMQPMNFTRLYCDSATGFGDWAINISPRGERDLRDHNRRDRKIFGIIIKKIKELSNGHFSPDNQKRLNNNHVEIPIYEAKMTGDLRLVHQVDCVPAYDTTSERQALKIFGVYTHAQIGRVSFWDSMGRELGKKGKEYKERCAFRKTPHHTGDHVYAPGIFPSPMEVRSLPAGSAPDLPPDDLEQMQSLLLKSVHFSQPLLDSIIAGRDASFVLQVSPREQSIIEHPYSCYVLGRSGTGKTTTMLYKMLLVEADYELSKEESPETPKRRQLFVTQSRILAEKVEEHFSKLSAGYRPSTHPEGAAKVRPSTFALVDIDDEINWRSDLPKRYSDLRDEHFPLFVTFDRLCGMLESDMEEDPCSGFSAFSANYSATDRASRPARLTYDRFLERYWPHFPQTLTKGLDPSMVYSEFLGVIMGAEETLTCASSCLDRETYLSLSERAQSTFADQRQRVYDLFESYVNQKRLLGDLDAADRTHAILRYLEQRGRVPGKKMDYLYVDETQDNLLIDALLLRGICHNPNGLFWAGDTAQTISVGSSFRFNELKAFLYRIEQRRLETSKQPDLYYQPVLQPRTFQLTVNYRSHAGIVNCAHTVIDVITRFWPYAIDVLDPERGTVDGLRPVFFTGFDSGNVQYEQFLFGDREGSYIEFGAQQCILVRDDKAREQLRAQVGDIGLIMTLYESKGLEFNDVLIFNFFENSPVGEAQWRVVLNAIENQKNVPAPMFDKSRHAGVCVELKFLYVAITRARNNVWIADTSPKGEPMRMLWSSKSQVQTCTPGTDTPKLAISSTAEEWEEQGRKLFANKRYQQSKHCFERALLPRQAAMAGAYYLRAEARKCPAGSSRRVIEARRTAFLEAALAFVDCAQEDKTLAYFRIAAECFEDAGDDLQAAQIYRDAKEYTRSTELYRKLGNFDEAVDNVANHREEIRPDVVANVTNVARLFYFKEHKLERANALFSSYEEALEYLEDRGLDVAHATLLESLGRFCDAAEVHLEEGRTLEAIKLFLRDSSNKHAMRRGAQCILQSLWQRVSFAVLPHVDDPSVSPLLALAAKADTSFLSENERNEAICRRDISKLQPLGEAFEATNPAAALLRLDHCFTNAPKIQALQANGVAKELQAFFAMPNC